MCGNGSLGFYLSIKMDGACPSQSASRVTWRDGVVSQLNVGHQWERMSRRSC